MSGRNCIFHLMDQLLLLHAGETEFEGYRTILAYPAPNHHNRVNYYSGPGVMFGGLPTGDSQVRDNARVIRENRQAMAQFGDESETCGNTTIFKIN